MDNQEKIEFIESTQQAVEQMKEDDINEYGDAAFEEFDCACCGEDKILAGSLLYEDKKLCNDCVLLAEISLGLGKIKHIDELIAQMEDKRLETLCQYIKQDEKAINN
ncbi:MAG: hypothetical protein WCK67_04720 [bacterium]